MDNKIERLVDESNVYELNFEKLKGYPRGLSSSLHHL